jgi:uroporphyrinogen decarboxylase
MSTIKRIEDLVKKIIDELGKDKLTPLERLNKLRRFEEADRVTGSFTFWSPSTVGINDISTEEYYTNPEKMYYCQLLALDTFKHDFPLLFADNYNTEPEALGAKISFSGSGHDTPMIVEPAMKNRDDLYKLQIPDPFKDGRLPYRIEICRIHHEMLGKFFPTSTSINAPFSMAVGMRGYEALVIDMLEDPDFVHNLLDFCTEVIIAFGKAIKSVCGSYPSLADAWSSIPNLSPDAFFEFSFPYAARCLQVFDKSGWSLGGGHQFSGDWKRSLRRILSSGSKSLMLFEENITGIRGGKPINLREIKEICKKRGVFLYTTIHPDTMLKGPPSKIETLMTNWIKEVASGGGHGFFTSVLSGTPVKHIETFVSTIRKSTFPTR